MLWFYSDYQEGCHPRILKVLTETNLSKQNGYGRDAYSTEAISLIKEQIGGKNPEVHFVSGGTQANLISISAFLRPHNAVVACDSAHIVSHECGAIEGVGHKIISTPNKYGKILVSEIKEILNTHVGESYVKPKMVFISNSTELGTVYTKKELTDLREFTIENDLYLFLDGARLGAALASEKSDLKLSELSSLVDAFYLGGTKNGALVGEAIVINNPLLQSEFRFLIKQKGGLLAKGRFIGIQFLELFKDNLYFELGARANQLAQELAKTFIQKGYQFLAPPETNQIFPIIPDKIILELEQSVKFARWKKMADNSHGTRFVTSWATEEEDVFKLQRIIPNI